MKYECVECGTRWPITMRKEWGTNAETSGYGREVRCVALVPAPGAPPAFNRQGEREEPLQCCGGPLVPVADDPALDFPFEDSQGRFLEPQTAAEARAMVEDESITVNKKRRLKDLTPIR